MYYRDKTAQFTPRLKNTPGTFKIWSFFVDFTFSLAIEEINFNVLAFSCIHARSLVQNYCHHELMALTPSVLHPLLRPLSYISPILDSQLYLGLPEPNRSILISTILLERWFGILSVSIKESNSLSTVMIRNYTVELT